MRTIAIICLLVLAMQVTSAQMKVYRIPQYDPDKTSDSFIQVLKNGGIDTIFKYREKCWSCNERLYTNGQSHTFNLPDTDIVYVLWSEKNITFVKKFDPYAQYDTLFLSNKAPFTYLKSNYSRLNKDSFIYTVKRFGDSTLDEANYYTGSKEKGNCFLYIKNRTFLLSKEFNIDMRSQWDSKFIQYFTSPDNILDLMIENDLKVFLGNTDPKPLTKLYHTKSEFVAWRKKQKKLGTH